MLTRWKGFALTALFVPGLALCQSISNIVRSLDRVSLPEAIANAPQGPSRDLGQGVLDSWTGKLEASQANLHKLLLHRKEKDSTERAIALEYLAFDDALEGQYRMAAKLGDRALKSSRIPIHGNDLDDFKSQVEVWKVLRGQPPILVGDLKDSTIPRIANETGRIEVAVSVDSTSTIALLDTGAEMSVVSESFFKRLGVPALPGGAHDTGSTGVQTITHVAMIDTLRLGDTLLRHVPVMVEDDSSLALGPPGHQTPIDMIVGYPVLRSLGAITIRKNEIVISDSVTSGKINADLLEKGLIPILTSEVDGISSRFLIDTGANATVLTKSYFETHRAQFSESTSNAESFAGVGGTQKKDSFRLSHLLLNMKVGTVVLSNVRVFHDDSALDVEGVVGNMGRDLWDSFAECTLDFRSHKVWLN